MAAKYDILATALLALLAVQPAGKQKLSKDAHV